MMSIQIMPKNDVSPDQSHSFLTQISQKWKIIGLLALILVGGWWYYTTSAAQQPEQTFITPTRSDIEQTLTVSGTIDAKEKARLRFIAGGKVTYLNAQQGDTVTDGQTIAVIDRAALEKQLQQDLNNYMTERWNWEETLDDNQDTALDTSEIRQQDQEQWKLDNQVLNVEIRDIAIRNTVLSAPFAGILTVSPTTTTGVQLIGTDYFEVVNPKSLVFVARVDEVDIGQVKLAQNGKIILDAYLDQTFESFVDHIAFSSNQSAAGTTFNVELPLHELPERELFRLGMNGDVTLLLAEKDNVLTIPIIATKERDGRTYVTVKNADGSTQDREIQTGIESDRDFEVVSGLNEDEQILLPE
ncbi:MAG: efflux RND transporter periplasmic adaptor subunit [Patescibacteria group bacterium]